jgi:hypothetical protein
MASRVTLVTNNEREFRRIPNLAVENWVKRLMRLCGTPGRSLRWR